MAVKNHSIKRNLSLLLGKSVNFCLQGNFLQTKDEVINASYIVAFGRYPSSLELRYWLHSDESTIKGLVAAHQKSIINSSSEQQEIIIRSYKDALGRMPKQNELDYWSKRPDYFSNLLAAHVNRQEDLPEERGAMINLSYLLVFDRPANDYEISYWIAKTGFSFAQLVAIHTTWKLRGQLRSQVTGFQENINQHHISTVQFSAQALSGIFALGGNYLISPGGSNVLVIGT